VTGSIQIVVPKVGIISEDAYLDEWLKQPGDRLAVGEEVCAMEFDKARVMVEAPASGVLVERLAAEGDRIAVGEPIALMTPD